MKKNGVAIKASHNKMLDEIVEKRIKEGSPVDSKVSVVAELITKAHKKEVNK